jgi:hypothetical protein
MEGKIMATKEEREAFSTLIEDRVRLHNVSTMEAIIDYCEESGLELEVAATLLNKTLKTRLEEEATRLKFLHKSKGKP